MAQQVIKYKLDNGEDISIMVPEIISVKENNEGFELAGAQEKVVQYAADTFEKSLDKIKVFSHLIMESLKSVKPDELKVEFGITFTAGAGVIISLGTEFNIKVELTWKKDTEPQS